MLYERGKMRSIYLDVKLAIIRPQFDHDTHSAFQRTKSLLKSWNWDGLVGGKCVGELDVQWSDLKHAGNYNSD